MSLPIAEIEVEFLKAFRDQNRIILEAPTGSGKSTQIPQMLHRAGLLNEGELVVLQPRRIAARMLARRVAFEMGENLGGLVGYQVRNENVSSRQTRIRFVTEGILLRRFINDPELRGVVGIVFDEFHERSLHGDLTLARANMLQRSLRPDLKMVVMSATLDSIRLEEYLDPCEIVRSSGRVFPVEVSHIDERTSQSKTPIWDLVARSVANAVKEQREGHVLVFMPGAFEIRRTIRSLGERLSATEFKLLPLHSELSPRGQDAAIDACDRRKVIVSTNVAETSLTIDDVRLVVDSGQARIARYDPQRGINTLWIEKISHASAKQRMGRAGRTAPGKCVRLWSERDHAQRAEFDLPEIQRMDLAESLLAMLATGIENLDTFKWFESPSESRMIEARELLLMLNAIDEQGRLTREGSKMSEFPLHPRYGAMMLAANHYNCVQEMSLAAAIAQSKGVLLRNVDRSVQARREQILGDCSNSDLIAHMRAWSGAKTKGFSLGYCKDLGINAQTVHQVEKGAEQISRNAQYADLSLVQEVPAAEEVVVKCLLTGFPDRVCKRLDRGTLRAEMTGGLRGMLARESAARDSDLFIACEINEIGRQSGEVSTVLNLCSRIEREWLDELFPTRFQSGSETVFDEKQKRVVERAFVRYRDLIIESKENLDVDLGKAARELAKVIGSGKAKLDKWDAEVESYLERVRFVASHFNEYEIDEFDEEVKGLLIEHCCYGAKSVRDLKRQKVLSVVKSWFGTEVDSVVEQEAPVRIKMKNGKTGRLRYESGVPVLSAKIQELYDLKQVPKMCQGRCSPKLEILAPNMRPVQLTDDLEAFWTTSYPSIKKELLGRYPKHEWR